MWKRKNADADEPRKPRNCKRQSGRLSKPQHARYTLISVLAICYCFDNMLVKAQKCSSMRCVYTTSTMTNDQQLMAVVHAGLCRGSARHAAVPLPRHTSSVTQGQQVTHHAAFSRQYLLRCPTSLQVAPSRPWPRGCIILAALASCRDRAGTCKSKLGT